MAGPAGMESAYTWMDGALVPTEKAVLPFLTCATHYGLAVFEGIRCYDAAAGPAIFRLDEHIRRLVDSARNLGLPCPYDARRLAEACLETVAANGFRSCYVRPAILVAGGGWNLSLVGVRVAVGIAVWNWGAYLGPDALAAGVRANVSSYTRHHPNVMMTKSKVAGNYANSALAKTESVRLGFDEAIMLDPQGFVSECTGENLFLVRKGTVYTTPRATILEGVTRDALLTIARDLGYPVSEQVVTRDQLYMADELFVCGTAAEVIGLREVDHRPIGSGATGPVTRALQAAFHDAVRGKTPRYASWLTPVPAASTVSV